MPTKQSQRRLAVAQQRIAALRRVGLTPFDYVCTGTVSRQMLPCGKSSCRCKHDPAARHGPYYYWGRRRGGRLVRMLLAPEEVRIIQRGLRNYRAVMRTVRRWEDETVRVINALRDRKDG